MDLLRRCEPLPGLYALDSCNFMATRRGSRGAERTRKRRSCAGAVVEDLSAEKIDAALRSV